MKGNDHIGDTPIFHEKPMMTGGRGVYTATKQKMDDDQPHHSKKQMVELILLPGVLHSLKLTARP